MSKDFFIFDFDGTIADTLPYIYKVSNLLADEYDFGRITKGRFQELKEKSPVEIIRELNIPILKIPFILGKGRTLLKKYMKDVKCFPGMVEVLHNLKNSGKTVGMLTSNSMENINLFLDKNKIIDFDFVFTENNLFGKQLSLSRILKDKNIPKDKAIYIGDEVRDIEACRVMELDIISVTWGFSSKEILKKNEPTFLVDSPKEITTLFL